MFALNLPYANTKIVVRNEKQMVFDFLRKRFVALTPEEWVRQQFTHFLVEHKGYPAMFIGNEITLSVGRLSRRCDSVVFNKSAEPVMIIEYKAPTVKITQKVFEQICSYNIALHAPYLTVSNGLQSYCCRIDKEANTYEFLKDIPAYGELL
jgi:hypothetical protein